ncbi:MAG: protein-disulfide reductase DsbD domain-containing protein [Alphaproteobacteria bacterium]
MTFFPYRAILRGFSLIAAASALLLSGADGAWAAAGAWWSNDHGAVRLVAETDAVGQSDELRAGLHFRMKPGWKIYWRSPGDAGFPPQPNWAGSENVAKVRIAWPAPVRFTVLGLQTLGYHDEVLLPLDVTAFEPGKAVRLRAKVSYLTCAEICVPYEATLALDVPAGPATSAREAGLIERFNNQVPVRGPDAPFAVAGAWADGVAGKQTVRLVARAKSPFVSPDFMIEGPAGFRFGPPGVTLGRDRREVVVLAAVTAPSKSVRAGKPTDLTGAALTLTVIDGDRAAERGTTTRRGVTGLPSPDAHAPQPVSLATLLSILGLAVLGGLILNLMPCVLPVLSLKLLAVVGHAGTGDLGAVRRGFLASAAGILTSFLVLGTVAVALKAGGLTAGWGIQFQQPVFLAVMAALVMLFASNLWGLFEIRLPGMVADAAAGAGDHHGRHGVAGHFATGAFATLLATPCSAPFLGTAVGFALARGPGEIYAVFAALGIGLALPYIAVALFPALATHLPRPGHWMITLRRVLGVALAATAAWLLSVLHSQAGGAAMLAAARPVAAIPVLFMVVRGRSGVSPTLLWGGVAALVLLGAILPVSFTTVPVAVSVTAKNGIQWQRFAPDTIASHVASGKLVFVDVTADWCITCQVNKTLVLDSDDMRARLKESGVIAMRADWTRPDPAITDFLRRFSRYGIPFNIVFGPGRPEGHVLPELLTQAAVTAALDAARSRANIAGR